MIPGFKLLSDFTQPRFGIVIPIFMVRYPKLHEYVNLGIPKFTGDVN